MSTTLKTFNFTDNHAVRVIVDDSNEPWFVAKDVAEVLGYAYPAQSVRKFCKSPKLLKGVEATTLTSSPRGITIIPERDVYRLIMRSKLPQAEEFEEWVVGTVLPSIRKHGAYIQGQENLDEDMSIKTQSLY